MRKEQVHEVLAERLRVAEEKRPPDFLYERKLENVLSHVLKAKNRINGTLSDLTYALEELPKKSACKYMKVNGPNNIRDLTDAINKIKEAMELMDEPNKNSQQTPQTPQSN